MRRVGRRSGRWLRIGLERLECRRLLCAEPHPNADELGDLGTAPLVEDLPAVPLAEVVDGGGGVTRSLGKLPLTSVPELSSLPTAEATLYLDFNGHFEEQWGSFRNVRTPAFDLDGDPQTFTPAELERIRQIWAYVAEDYAPFKLNVTTVEPPSFGDGLALRVAIGGDGLWSGGKYGGVAYVDSFTNYLPNTVYVFAKNLGAGNARFVADAVSHESGHGFGLYHQSQYRGTTKVDEYYKGPGDGRAPLMGSSFAATRSLWWMGTSAVSYRHIQDVMAHIARRTNGFGYRPDDHGNSVRQATELAISGTTATGAGVIEQTTDVDYFAFQTGKGRIVFTVSVAAGVNNLDATLKLLDNQGRVIAAADPSSAFNATVAANITRAGKYYVVVGSHGLYGDVGQYTLQGTIVPQRSRSLGEPEVGFGPLATTAARYGESDAPLAMNALLRSETAGGPGQTGEAAASAVGAAADASSKAAAGMGLWAVNRTSTAGTAVEMPAGRLPAWSGHSALVPATFRPPAPLVAASATAAGEAAAAHRPYGPKAVLPQHPARPDESHGPHESLLHQLVDRVFETWWL